MSWSQNGVKKFEFQSCQRSKFILEMPTAREADKNTNPTMQISFFDLIIAVLGSGFMYMIRLYRDFLPECRYREITENKNQDRFQAWYCFSDHKNKQN